MLFVLFELAEQIIEGEHDIEGINVIKLIAGTALLDHEQVTRCDLDVLGDPVAEPGIEPVLIKDIGIVAHGLAELQHHFIVDNEAQVFAFEPGGFDGFFEPRHVAEAPVGLVVARVGEVAYAVLHRVAVAVVEEAEFLFVFEAHRVAEFFYRRALQIGWLGIERVRLEIAEGREGYFQVVADVVVEPKPVAIVLWRLKDIGRLIRILAAVLEPEFGPQAVGDFIPQRDPPPKDIGVVDGLRISCGDTEGQKNECYHSQNGGHGMLSLFI